ncbi:DUF3072 domain-containing protein [Methylobacterium nodulans]|uniref:DUF3072 domain-containing protein n=1 Tax=Methylobacterium nodulans (strain LMG 21967 / CNCM I-2342 / ORS 2060) TaxID=460265 RepID=B8ILN3_METNO|nr:DUF3072 domain-containing protein [Methylobacterium nodulans]ACL62008.1 conserved hypothetical protein [Methylobacterium nodulans ORS 2060]
MSARTKDQRNRNPKAAPPDAAGDASNRIKDPKDWTTGDEPMTGAQASYLKTLSEQAGDQDAFDPDLDKAEASERIDALRKATGKA